MSLCPLELFVFLFRKHVLGLMSRLRFSHCDYMIITDHSVQMLLVLSFFSLFASSVTQRCGQVKLQIHRFA